jgi:hypothetical protein
MAQRILPKHFARITIMKDGRKAQICDRNRVTCIGCRGPSSQSGTPGHLNEQRSQNWQEKDRRMSHTLERTVSKVPQVTLVFWIIKIAATTLGETGGDAVSMSMNLGYLVATAIFAAIFLVAVVAQIRAKGFHPFLYWATIIATTTVGTTLADFADRSLGGRLCWWILAIVCPADGIFGHLVSVTWHDIGRYRQFSKGRDVLLGDDHVFPNLGHCVGRLDR